MAQHFIIPTGLDSVLMHVRTLADKTNIYLLQFKDPEHGIPVMNVRLTEFQGEIVMSEVVDSCLDMPPLPVWKDKRDTGEHQCISIPQES